MTKQGALEKLIKSMFSDTELRSFLGQMARTAPLLEGIPGGSAPLVQVALETVGILDRNNLIDSEFFVALGAVRPGRRQEIQEVAGLWGLALPVTGAARSEDDGESLARQAVKAAAEHAELDRMLQQDEPAVWGLHAANRERQALVDAALDRCTDTKFCALVQVIAQPRRTSLGLVGAHEALFTAAARRLSRGNFAVPSADIDAWHRLVELQIGSLVTSGIARHPYTREGEHFEAWNTFWADGWTFSLRIPPPPRFDHPDLVWYFPGWAKQLDSSPMPKSWPMSSVSPIQASEGVRRMSAMAFEVLPKLVEQPSDVRFPRVLLPALLLLAPSRGWYLTAKFLSGFTGTWEEKVFARRVAQLVPEERVRHADVLWDILPAAFAPEPTMSVTQRLRRIESISRRLLPFVMENVSEAALSRTIASEGVDVDEFSVESLRLLPRPLRHVCARAVLAAARDQSSDWDEARTIARVLDSAEDVEFLLDIIRESNANVAAEFTAFVWRVDPARAADEAEDAFRHGRASAHGWFHYVPQADLPRLLQVVEESPGPLPPWMQEWAKRRALDGGSCSERLFGLAHARPADDSKTQKTQPVESTATPEQPVGAQPINSTKLPPAVAPAPPAILPHSGRASAYAEIELAFERSQGGYRVMLRMTDPGSDAELAPIQGPTAINLEELLASQADTNAYGRLLTKQVFSDQRVRERYLTAQATFERGGLLIRIRVSIDPTSKELHELRWELLRDPEADAPLATSERILLSRFMTSQDSRRVKLRPRAQLRAVIAVSAPSNFDKYGLGKVDLAGEIERAQEVLVDTSMTIIGKDQPLTLEHLKTALRAGADIVYLVCHGGFSSGNEPILYLQDIAGLVAPVKAADFAQQIRELAEAPCLMVLASCESATRDGATALQAERTTAQTSLAPLLANAGVSAVLAMQGKISMRTVKAAMPVFFKELMKDGQIDRALAVARGAVRGHPDDWMPALFLRLKGGRLWSDPTPAEPRPSERVIPASAKISGEPVRERPPWDATAEIGRILRDGPAEVIAALDAYIPGDPAQAGERPADVALRVAGEIDGLGEGLEAALELVVACCDTLSRIKEDNPANLGSAQRTLCRLISEWMPRRYDTTGNLTRAIHSPHSRDCPDLEVDTANHLVGAFEVARADERQARIDGKKLRSKSSRSAPVAAPAEMLKPEAFAQQIIDDVVRPFAGQYNETPQGRLEFAQGRLTALRRKTRDGRPGRSYDPQDLTLTSAEWNALMPAEARAHLKKLLPGLRQVALTTRSGPREGELVQYLIELFQGHDDDEGGGA